MFATPSRLRRGTALIGALALLTLLLPMAPAGANALFTGACAVRVQINFKQDIRLTGTSPDYDISLNGAVDLDGSATGTQACVLTFDLLEPLRRTSASGTGDSTTWSCTSAFSSGSWTQTFRKSDGSLSPDSVSGTHTIAGTWDAWTLEVTTPGLNFVGVAELTLEGLQENQKLEQCLLVGVSSLTMVGTMVFQDP